MARVALVVVAIVALVGCSSDQEKALERFGGFLDRCKCESDTLTQGCFVGNYLLRIDVRAENSAASPFTGIVQVWDGAGQHQLEVEFASQADNAAWWQCLGGDDCIRLWEICDAKR